MGSDMGYAFNSVQKVSFFVLLVVHFPVFFWFFTLKKIDR